MKAFISILILFVSWSLSMGAATATYTDGVTQIFNPSNTRAGMNVGSITGDPSTVNNGDVWYATSDHTIRLRINGATEALATKEWVITQGYGNAQADEVVFLDGSTPMTGLLSFTGTTHPGIRLNQLTTAQQDAMTPLSGYFIGNTTTGLPSYYNGSAWITLGGGSNRTIADLSTVLSTSTWTLVSGTDYYGSTSAARTIVLPGSPTAGDLINITQLIVTSGPITVTLPMVYRAGTASTTTSISLPTGNHALSFEYVNATWVLKDTGVDAEAANTVYGNPTAGALNPVFTPTPVVDSITVDSEAYDATNWNGDDTVPTKNDVRDHLVLLAPLASPTLTGTPAAPTAAAGTDTTQIATTAYVQDEVDSTLTGSHTTPSTTNPLAPTWTGPTHVVFYGATGEIDLPAASGYTGRGIIVYNTGSFTVSLDPDASEVIVRDGTVQTGGVTITLSSGAGNYVALLSDGVRWITLGYKGTLAAGS